MVYEEKKINCFIGEDDSGEVEELGEDFSGDENEDENDGYEDIEEDDDDEEDSSGVKDGDLNF